MPAPLKVGTQQHRILERLRGGGWVSNWHVMHPEADPGRAIGQYQTRVLELRRRGYVIECVSRRQLEERGYPVPADAPGLYYYRLVAPVARPPSSPEARESLRALARSDDPPPAICRGRSRRRPQQCRPGRQMSLTEVPA